jgi:hypothetical protein
MTAIWRRFEVFNLELADDLVVLMTLVDFLTYIWTKELS